MSDSIFQIGTYLLAGIAAGAGIGWLVRGADLKRRLEKLKDEWLVKFDDAARQRDRFNAENSKLRTSIEAQQALVHKHELITSKFRTELESEREKTKMQLKDLFTLRAERDELKTNVNNTQNAINAANQQIAELQGEFVKSGEIYKGQLEKAFDKRKTLESKLDDAKLEHDSLSNLLQASKLEHASANKMLASAQTRLSNLDALEQKAIELEAANAQLRHDATRTKQEIESLQRDVLEQNELKVQNKELAHCLESMENSRKQYESDAKRYRVQADQSEQRSETMRVKLDDVENSFAEMAKQHNEALKVVRTKEAAPESNGKEPPKDEVDDLTEIIGIGKVFEQALHDLGVFSFRQIAAFGPADIARVNVELKEFKGRMEQDDWVGQAKELHFKKYGGAATH